ncbi:uncharacterized protein LOC134194316 isoform X2 [Corticium candelabrum]|uniref:uncharacterized protein LOC134194316 isoform X2 n=1 Tax=Corticium candelabrum TaxID=121492 RepID=UPI002E262288|nr:uncharacterized protein LOC134194316 isoform X2 [Corticium candelabrum]
MFKIQEHHRKKKKQQFETEKKPVDELFVFHGTSGKILRPIIVLLYCIEEYVNCQSIQIIYQTHFLCDKLDINTFVCTTDTLIDAIVKDGFKVGGKDIRTVSGSMYGIAVYTAENPSVAMLYAKRGESKKLLLSRILPGREDEDYTRGADEHVFVLETSEQLLPQYVVHIGSN